MKPAPIQPGRIQTLPVFEIQDKFLLLGDARRSVPLARREAPKDVEPGSEIQVFIFYNDQRELEATTRLPEIEVGGIASFRVISANDLGAFVNIGTRRDILIPKREQRVPLEKGYMALVTLQEDEANQRLYGSTRITPYFRNQDIPFQRGDEVEMIIAERIEIGWRVIINGKYLGVLFRQEVMRKVREGEKVKGYIRKVEGKDIVVSMQKEGEEAIQDAVARLMEFLEANNGYLRLNDDSDPEEIKLRLRMSKKTFKKAVGHLYKDQKIAITRFGIKLVRPEKPVEEPKPRRKRMDDSRSQQ